MTVAVDLGRKATKQTNQMRYLYSNGPAVASAHSFKVHYVVYLLILIELHLKLHQVVGSLWADWIGTLVAMATYSFHRLTMGKKKLKNVLL